MLLLSSWTPRLALEPQGTGPLLPDEGRPEGVARLASPSSPCLSSLARSQELLSLAVYGARRISSFRAVVPNRILDLLWFF